MSSSSTRRINAKFRTDILKFRDMSKSKIQQATRDALLEVGRRLVDYSPVGDPERWAPPYNYWPKGYEPGHFKNNWQVGIGERPTGIIQGSDPTGQGSIDRMRALSRWPAGKTFYFANNLPYAYALETGWSTQCPPGGMIGRIKREWAQIVSEAARNVKTSKGSVE